MLKDCPIRLTYFKTVLNCGPHIIHLIHVSAILLYRQSMCMMANCPSTLVVDLVRSRRDWNLFVANIRSVKKISLSSHVNVL